MNCLATWSFDPWLRSKSSIWATTEEMLAVAWASLHYSCQYVSKPRVYTDTLGQYVLSQLTDQAEYVRVLDGFYDAWHPDYFAMAKLATMADQKQPYCHTDLDWIWHQPPRPSQADLVVHGWERLDTEAYHALGLDQLYNLDQWVDRLELPSGVCWHGPNTRPAVNMGCVIMLNLELNREYIELVDQIIEHNPQAFLGHNKLGMCSLEQHVMGLLCHDRGYDVDVIFRGDYREFPTNAWATHFVGDLKSNRLTLSRQIRHRCIGARLTARVRALAKELDEERARI